METSKRKTKKKDSQEKCRSQNTLEGCPLCYSKLISLTFIHKPDKHQSSRGFLIVFVSYLQVLHPKCICSSLYGSPGSSNLFGGGTGDLHPCISGHSAVEGLWWHLQRSNKQLRCVHFCQKFWSRGIISVKLSNRFRGIWHGDEHFTGNQEIKNKELMNKLKGRDN